MTHNFQYGKTYDVQADTISHTADQITENGPVSFQLGLLSSTPYTIAWSSYYAMTFTNDTTTSAKTVDGAGFNAYFIKINRFVSLTFEFLSGSAGIATLFLAGRGAGLFFNETIPSQYVCLGGNSRFLAPVQNNAVATTGCINFQSVTNKIEIYSGPSSGGIFTNGAQCGLNTKYLTVTYL